jgi:hypothetical protein
MGKARPVISCFFGTGTGRCGTQLLAKVLDLWDGTQCRHEFSVDTLKMKRAYQKGNLDILAKDARRLLFPTVQANTSEGTVYGEVSGHLYLLYPELFRRYGHAARFFLLVRRPDAFVRSALARGFFDPGHPRACEHVIPPQDTDMGERWATASPLEKCAWYWGMVNGTVLSFFRALPPAMSRVVRLEDLSLSLVRELYAFLGFSGFEALERQASEVLGQRHNASPGTGDERFVNPHSEEISLGPLGTWTAEQRRVFDRHVLPVWQELYPEDFEAALGVRDEALAGTTSRQPTAERCAG